MHETASASLSAFDMAAILVVASALLGWFNHHFLKLPHVIGLTVMGALGAIGLMVANTVIPGITLDDTVARLLQQLNFTDTLLQGMLSFLLFAGALHVDLERLRSAWLPVLLLSTVGVIVSTVLVGLAVWGVGLLLGLGVARWRQLADRGVASADELEATTEAPLLGAIAYDRSVQDAPLLTSLSPQHPRAESIRILRTNLQFVDVDHDRTVITVTSAVEAEGKTSTACNLAIALAQSGLRVALVEGDLRRPQLAEQFGLESTVGLTTVLVGRVELDEAMQETEIPGLDVLTSGARPPNPAEIVQTGAMEQLVADLRRAYDIVLIDAPPLLPVTDATILALLSDGALLVVRHGRTGHDQVRAAVERLQTVGATLFGTVLSMSPRRAAGRFGYGYEYATQSSRRRPRRGR